MARLNPRRRRLAKALHILAVAGNENGKAHDDSHLLQQGAVRSSFERYGKLAPVNAKSIAHRVNSRPDGFAPAWITVNGRAKYQGDK